MSLSDGPHDGFHREALSGARLDRHTACRTAVVRVLYRVIDVLQLASEVRSLVRLQVAVADEVAVVFGNGWVRVVFRMCSHVLCEGCREPVCQAALAE